MNTGTSADVGGAAFDSNGELEGNSSTVWVMAGFEPEVSQLYVSLHSTEAGARQRLRDKAEEWGVPLSEAGEVQPCEVEP